MKLEKILSNFVFFVTLLIGFPFKLSAQGISIMGAGANFRTIIYDIIRLLNLLVPVMFGGAFIVFFWGLSKFILNSNSPAEVTKGKSYMFWGVIALFVLVSVRAIINLIAVNLEIGSTSGIPQLRQL